MPRRNLRKNPARRRVSFKLSAPGAKMVNLAGSFNDWDTGIRKLRSDKAGVWKTTMLLEPGTYEYRYVVDGEWRNEPLAQCVPNPVGSENCLRLVE